MNSEDASGQCPKSVVRSLFEFINDRRSSTAWARCSRRMFATRTGRPLIAGLRNPSTESLPSSLYAVTLGDQFVDGYLVGVE